MSMTAYKMSSPSYYPASLLADNISLSGVAFDPYVEGATYPAGWMRLSSKECTQFILAILNGGELNGNRILKAKTVEKMLDVKFPNANLAFNSGVALLWRSSPRGWIGHTAGGVSTHSLMLNPSTGHGFVIMTNTSAAFSLSPDPNNGLIYRAVEKYLEGL